MIIHLGENITIFEKDIVAVLDVETVLSSKENSQLIEKLIKDNRLVNYTNGQVKTYIIASEDGSSRKKRNQYKLYTSNISSTSLLRRIFSSK